MCIAVITTEHPEYPLILLNNRDVQYLTILLFSKLIKISRNICIAPHKKQPGGLSPTLRFLEDMTSTDRSTAPG